MKTLYYGGPIRTMETDAPAGALLVENGVIAAVGALEKLRARAGNAAEIDLEGRTLLPGFIDAHSHFSGAAYALLQAPLGEETDFAGIAQTLTRFIEDNRVPQGAWVVGKGYDQTALAEQRHPARALLDRVSASHPIMIVHQSGHMGVFNTRALELLGVTPDTLAPAGGAIGKEGGVLTGYMEENAFLYYQQQVPAPDLDDLLDACRRTQQMYASHGVTTVQEGMLPESLFPLYRELLARNMLELDVVAYPGVDALDTACDVFPGSVRRYDRHVKLGGCKMFLDGSPQSRTAWMRTPYVGGEDCGYPVLTDGQVYETVAAAAGAGRQILAHCNGDRAAEQYLQALKRAEEEGLRPERVRPVMIHAQLLGLDQLPELKRLGVIPSFFVAHVYHWGDTHIKNFGLERAASISPAASAGKLGLPYTFHQDAPVIRPDMLETVWCAVNRRTRDGVLLGGSEQVTVLEALRAVTIRAAYQYFEEKEKGSLEPGKQADLVILDKNPLETAPSCLRKIQVLETVKAGETVYRREK